MLINLIVNGAIISAFLLSLVRNPGKPSRKGDREENKAQKYLDIAGVIIVAINSGERVILINRKGCEILGYREEDILGKNWFDNFLPQDWGSKVKEVFQRIMAGSLEALEYYENPLLTANGEERIIAWHNTLLYDRKGRIAGTLSSGEDITEKKRAEEALRRERDFSTTLVQSSPAYFVALNPEGRIIMMNEAILRSLGYRADELAGKDYLKFCIPREEREQVSWAIENLVKLKLPVVLEHNLLTRDRKKRLVEWHKKPVFKENGELDFIVSFGIDVTQRKWAEEALNYRYEVEKLIAEISTNLIKLRVEEIDGEIDRVLKTIGEFARVDRSHVFVIRPDGSGIDNTHEWCRKGVQPLKKSLKGLPVDSLPWLIEHLKKNETVTVSRISELPQAAALDKKTLEAYHIQSVLIVPMLSKGLLIGFTAFDSVKEEKRWLIEDTLLLKTMSNIISNALERQWAEEALRKSQRTLATLMSNLPGMAYRCKNDRNYTMEFVSEGCFELTGYEPSDLVQNKIVSFMELIKKEDRKQVVSQVQAALEQGKPFQLVYRIKHRHGREKWVWEKGRGVCSPEGDLLALEGFITDITERKQAEEELIQERAKLELGLKNERLLARIASSLNLSVSFPAIMNELLAEIGQTANLDGACFFSFKDGCQNAVKLNYWNSGNNPSEIRCPKKMATRDYPQLFERLKDPGILCLENISGQVRKGKNFCPCQKDASVLVCPLAIGGKVEGFICFHKTGEHYWEQKDISLFQTLSDMFISAWGKDYHFQARLEAEKKQIEAIRMAEKASRLASLGTLAAGIAHEINQPLTALKIKADGALYFLEQQKKIPKRQYGKTLEFISQQASRISDIVRHMRALARQEKGKKAVPVKINDIVRRALSLIDEQLSSHGIKLEMNLEETVPPIDSHPTSLEQVVINLVVNAMNALNEYRRDEKIISVSTALAEENCVLQVRDNGPGIPEDYLERIFDPFFTAKIVGEGMGLGLSITENIITGIGGIITAANHADGGAVFTVLLPLSKSPAE